MNNLADALISVMDAVGAFRDKSRRMDPTSSTDNLNLNLPLRRRLELVDIVQGSEKLSGGKALSVYLVSR